MIHPISIDIEMRDTDGHPLLHALTHPKDRPLIHLLRSHLEEQMGGLLCMDHFNLPEFRTVHASGRWVVRITSCCTFHMQLLEQRLKEIFPVDE